MVQLDPSGSLEQLRSEKQSGKKMKTLIQFLTTTTPRTTSLQFCGSYSVLLKLSFLNCKMRARLQPHGVPEGSQRLPHTVSTP